MQRGVLNLQRFLRMKHRQTRRLRGGSAAVGANGGVDANAAEERFFGPAQRQVYTVNVDGEVFDMIVHLSPSSRLGPKNKAEIHRFFVGNRLGITDATIDEQLKIKNWDAVIYVKNRARDDSGVSTLQWAPWCPTTDAAKLWIHDVSRMGTVKGPVSPIKVIMDYAKAIARDRDLLHLYLLVDEKDKGGAPSSWAILTSIYAKPDYGFSTNVEGCRISDTVYTAMKAPAR